MKVHYDTEYTTSSPTRLLLRPKANETKIKRKLANKQSCLCSEAAKTETNFLYGDINWLLLTSSSRKFEIYARQ